MGRPTKLDQAVEKRAIEYLSEYKVFGHRYPTSQTLARVLGVHRATLYRWAKCCPEVRVWLDLIVAIHRGDTSKASFVKDQICAERR